MASNRYDRSLAEVRFQAVSARSGLTDRRRTVEIEGIDRPACVIDTIGRYYSAE